MSDQYPPPGFGGQQYGAPPPHGGQQYGSPPPSGGQQYGSPAPHGGQQYGSGQQYGGQTYGSPQYGGSSPAGGDPYGGQQGQPYGGDPQGGQPYGGSQPGQQYGGQQYGGQPYGGQPPAQFTSPVTVAPPKKSIGKKLAGIGGVIVVAIVIGVIKFGVGSGISSAINDDTPAEAKTGDCLARLPEVAAGQEKEANNATVVKCDAADAKFTVLGRIENQTAAQADSEDVCKAYPKAEYSYSSIPAGGKGYVLCLQEIKPKPASSSK